MGCISRLAVSDDRKPGENDRPRKEGISWVSSRPGNEHGTFAESRFQPYTLAMILAHTWCHSSRALTPTSNSCGCQMDGARLLIKLASFFASVQNLRNDTNTYRDNLALERAGYGTSCSLWESGLHRALPASSLDQLEQTPIHYDSQLTFRVNDATVVGLPSTGVQPSVH